MSYLKNIITYFFHHPASDGVVERVHQRLADTNSGQEKEEVLSGIWEQIGFPQADEHQTLRAFEKLEQQIGGDSLNRNLLFRVFVFPDGVGLLLLSSSPYYYCSVPLTYTKKLLSLRTNLAM